MRDLDKISGCLLAGAAGDALGYAVEFLRDSSIKKRYGPGGIREYDLIRGVAQISDDTQMTLFTASGLLSALARADGEWERGVWEAYLDWYDTQTKAFGEDKTAPGRSWLLNVQGLWKRRAPGGTCMGALGGGKPGSLERKVNNSAGCGGVMRAAPVGLLFCDEGAAGMDIDMMDRVAAGTAALTHGNDRAWLPSALLAHIVRREAVDGMTVKEAILDGLDALDRLFPNAPDGPKFRAMMKSAVELGESSTPTEDAIAQLGEGWVGDEAIAVAVFCAVRYPDDIESALIASVNHSGDSDSTGSIAGNILGASLGAKAIPEKFLDCLELKTVIEEVASDLAAPGESESFREKYVLGTYCI